MVHGSYSNNACVAMVNTATGGWNQHCATRNAHNLSLGPYINKATVKAFVRARAPQLRLAELLAYTEAAHLNYTDFVNQSYAQDLFFKAAHLTGGIARLRKGRLHCLKEPCAFPFPKARRAPNTAKFGGEAAGLMASACSAWLKSKVFGRSPQRVMYSAVQPGCLVEASLGIGSLGVRATPADIKVFCMHGRPVFFFVAPHRFDESWRGDGAMNTYFTIPSMRHLKVSKPRSPAARDFALAERPAPAYLPRLLRDAAALASGFESVRVDFLQWSETEYAFAELTFTDHACIKQDTFLPIGLEQLYGDLAYGRGNYSQMSNLALENLQLEIVHEYERAHTFACSNRTRLCGWECGGRFGCADLHRKLPYSCFRG